jgi:hypothetical protein
MLPWVLTMTRFARTIGLVVGMSIYLQGCSRTQESYLTVQTCLVDQQGVSQFLEMMRAVAKSENLKFVDGSAETGAALKTIGADKHLKRDPALTINVGIEGQGGMGVTAGNLGLPPYQVALGFTEGADAAKAHRLSDRLVQALSQRWHVETVPQGKGALPMKACGG